MSRIDLAWMFWQVAVPLAGPVLFSLVVYGGWWTFDLQPPVDFSRALADVSPWAVTFFSMALLSSTWFARRTAPARRLRESVAMTLVGSAVCLYAALIALARLDPTYRAGAKVWIVTGILWLCAVVVSHYVHSRLEGE